VLIELLELGLLVEIELLELGLEVDEVLELGLDVEIELLELGLDVEIELLELGLLVLMELELLSTTTVTGHSFLAGGRIRPESITLLGSARGWISAGESSR